MEKAREQHTALHRGRSLVACAILALSVAHGTTARAQGDASSKQQAAALLNEGNKLFDDKQFEAALKKYQEAYSVYSSPKILLNIAEANLQLGNNELAARAYERFLNESPEGAAEKQRKLASDRLETLKTKLGYIAIQSAVAGATVWVDGEEVGRAPLDPVRVEPGRREIRAELEGFQPFDTQTMIRAGKTETIVLELARIEPVVTLAPPAREAEVTPAIDAPASDIESPPSTVRAEAESEPITSKWWVWALAGTAVAAGVIIGVAAASGGDDFVPSGELGRSSTAEWQSLLIGRW